MTAIKICGLKSPEDISYVNEARPEYIGFVFYPGSRRYVAPEKALRLRSALSPGIIPVGVFVNEAPETVAALLNQGVIHMAQLHGEEDGAYIARLRTLTDQPIIQAFKIRGPGDAQAAAQSPADFILLDSGQGSGRTFNWDWIRSFPRPFFLAGGLTPENAAEALVLTRPFALDVSSGVETDGKKDPEKIKRFVKAVRKD